MKILCLQPEQRLNRTELNQVEDSKKTSCLVYACPVCGQETRFTYTDFLACAPSGLFYRTIFDKKSRLEKGEKILDFHCSRCDQPVRIEYTPGSSLRMLRILEIVLPSFPPKEELLARLHRVEDLFYSLSLGQPQSLFPYLWLASSMLFLLPYDNPNELARTFFQEKQKLEAVLGWSFAWEWLERVNQMQSQIFLWLAMILRFKEEVETASNRMLKISNLLHRQGMEKKPETLLMALILALKNRENKPGHIEHMVSLGKKIKDNYDPLWMLTLTDDFRPDRLQKINQDLSRRNFLLSEKNREPASLLLYLQGKSPYACVDRFLSLGEAFNQAVAQREKYLVNPDFFPDENHPFHKVVLSLLTEFSPVFPFDSSCFSGVALLSALSWRAEDLARESIELYHYLRSYRKFINPDMSFWVSTGIIFSSWEGGDSPDIFLFWIMASLAAIADLQRETARKISIHQV